MIVAKASIEAIKYACKNYHYSGKYNSFSKNSSYTIINDNNEFCGVVSFAVPCSEIHNSFNLANGEVYELVRVALNGKQGITSRTVMRAMKSFHDDFPFVKIIVSYSDLEERHVGKIYQAMNFAFLGLSKSENKILHKGKLIHSRTLKQIQKGEIKLFKYGKDIDVFENLPKLLYAYSFDKKIMDKLKKISLPYVKSVNDLLDDYGNLKETVRSLYCNFDQLGGIFGKET